MTTGADEAAAKLLAETRDEVTRADGKANLLLAATGVLVSVTVSAAVAGDVSLSDLAFPMRTVAWLGIFLVAAALFALAVAVWPRTAKRKPGRAHYFGDVPQYDTTAALREALAGIDLGERDAQQLHAVSILVMAKYRWTRRGMAFLAAGVVLLAVAWGIGVAAG